MEYTDAFHYYSRAIQYTLTIVTKGDPYRFVVQCNHNNSSGFETWRRLHVTYDQGEKAQHLNILARVMKPTWNNVTQQPSEIIRQFQNWRHEIFNYESTVQTDIATSMQMALLMQNIQGDIRSHLLLNLDLAKRDFESAATKVEDYYRNIYIDNNYSTRVHGLKGKYGKGKDKGKKGKGATKRKGVHKRLPAIRQKKRKIRITTIQRQRTRKRKRLPQLH
eukprot:4581956-Amphidinium_carterae.2